MRAVLTSTHVLATLASLSLALTLLVVSPSDSVAAGHPHGSSTSPTAATGPDTSRHAQKGPRSSGGRLGRGTLVSLPPVIQPGRRPAAPRTHGQLVATFTPPRPGRIVILQRRAGHGWRDEARSPQDSWGSASFEARPGVYRARSILGDGREVRTGRIRSRSWSPEFEDTFSGTALDSRVWNDQEREHESVYAPRTCARVDPAARRVGGGVLHLGVALDPARLGQRCSYTSPRASGEQSYLLNSQVATEHTRAFRHGIVSARIKPQRAKGMHSGFWMLPQGTRFTDGNPAMGTEIDVVEFFGENSRGNETIGSFVGYYEPGWHNVTYGDLFPAARRVLRPGARWWEEFHVFSVEWTAHQYIFRIDGREYYRETKAVSHAPQYLVLSMLTSNYELGHLSADKLDDTAEVDWVQVFDATSSRVATSAPPTPQELS